MFDPFATSPPILTGSGSQSGPLTATNYTPASIVLTPGTWLATVTGIWGYSTAPTVTLLKVGIGSANATPNDFYITPFDVSVGVALSLSLAVTWIASGVYTVPTGTTKTIYGGMGATFTGGTVLVYTVSMIAQYLGN